jgi:hypothetical protein
MMPTCSIVITISWRISCWESVGGTGSSLPVARLVAEVRAFVASGVPLAFGRVQEVVAAVLILVVTDVVEYEELGLGAEIGDVADAGRLQIRLRLLGDVARITRVLFLRDRIEHVADQAQRRYGGERIHHSGGGIRHDQHVGCVDRLPTANRRTVEAAAFLEQRFAELGHRNREVLPGAEKIQKLQIDAGRLLLFGKLDHLFRRHARRPPLSVAMPSPARGSASYVWTGTLT